MCLEVWYIPGKYLSGESGTASKLPSTSKVKSTFFYLACQLVSYISIC